MMVRILRQGGRISRRVDLGQRLPSGLIEAFSRVNRFVGARRSDFRATADIGLTDEPFAVPDGRLISSARFDGCRR